MDPRLAFVPSAAGHFLLAALVFVAIKLAAALLQIALLRGNYRETPKTTLFRVVYILGKVTPSLAAACACAAALLLGDEKSAWFFGLFAVFTALLAAYLVRLRKQRRFFGLLEMTRRRG